MVASAGGGDPPFRGASRMAENELILEPDGEGSFKFTFVSDRRALAGRVGMGVEGPPDRRSKEDNGRRRKTSKGGKPRERGRQSCRALPRIASIAPDDALILARRVNPAGWNFRKGHPLQERQKRAVGGTGTSTPMNLRLLDGPQLRLRRNGRQISNKWSILYRPPLLIGANSCRERVT